MTPLGSLELPPFVARGTLKHRKAQRPAARSVAAARATLGAPNEAEVMSALQGVGLDVNVMRGGAVAFAHDRACAYLLQDAGDRFELYCCPALPRTPVTTLVRACADHCAAVARALGNGWTWEVHLSHVRGDEFPFRVAPTKRWFVAGGARSPLVQLLVAAGAIGITYGLQRMFKRDDLGPGAVLAFFVVLAQVVASWVLERHPNREYEFKAEQE